MYFGCAIVEGGAYIRVNRSDFTHLKFELAFPLVALCTDDYVWLCAHNVVRLSASAKTEGLDGS